MHDALFFNRTKIYGAYRKAQRLVRHLITTAEPVIHQRGLMWRAIRASTSIPGVYLPVIEGDDLLADGGACVRWKPSVRGASKDKKVS